MTHPYVLLPLVACLMAVVLASALLSHDAGQRSNRLVALILLCSAWWSLCEVLWNVQESAVAAIWLVRLSGPAWMALGPLCLDLLCEIRGNANSRLQRVVPGSYLLSAVCSALYVATPWCLAEAIPTAFGWSYRFGPLFPLVYGAILLPVVLVLINWPHFVAQQERRQGRLVLLGILVPLSAASLTDVVLPFLDVHVPRIGSASILTMGCVTGLSVLRHGSLMIAPGGFAVEIVESLADGVALVGPDGRLRSANGGLARLACLPQAALIGRPLAELLPGLEAHPTLPGEIREFDLFSSTHERVPVAVTWSPLRARDGATGGASAELGRVFAIHDLREVAALRSRLLTSGRLAAVGELAAGIAHEINNPISYVRANLVELRHNWQAAAEAAAGQPGLPDQVGDLLAEGEELLEDSLEGVDRMASVVRDVGAFAHAGRGGAELADLNALLDATVRVGALTGRVTVERSYRELPGVSCDPPQLKQVFLNLLMNAMQATGPGGQVRISTLARGQQVIVSIADDGPGIPADQLDRIFDPFFTTRPGEGLGLGLAQSYQIVRAHGGEIRVRTRVDAGSTFEVRLPAAADDA